MAIDSQIIAKPSRILSHLKHLYVYKLRRNSLTSIGLTGDGQISTVSGICLKGQNFSIRSPYHVFCLCLPSFIGAKNCQITARFSLTHIQLMFTFGLSYRYFLGNVIFKLEKFVIKSKNQLYLPIFTKEMLQLGGLGRELCKPETLSRVCITPSI